MATSMKFGADASIAAGPVGTGANQDVVSDLLSFSRAKGLYGGLNFDGTVVSLSDELNATFHGRKISVREILAGRGATGAATARLLRAAPGTRSTRRP